MGFFPDVTDLHQYSRIRDATPRSFYNTLWLLALANVGVIALEQCGVLLVETNRQEAAEARLTSMTASPNAPEGVSLASIDLDGDGFFSSRDVALLAASADERPAVTRELALLLQRGLAATAAANEPLPHWALYLPSHASNGIPKALPASFPRSKETELEMKESLPQEVDDYPSESSVSDALPHLIM